jgi:S-methylmethionine-dependent homocysteine/selenocysteine methylase
MTKTITILDGGMGKTLEAQGAPFRQPEWSALALIEAPETVQAAHADFVAAGAQVITTNNYAVVPFHLGRECFDSDGVRLTALSGELARAAAGPDVRVAGSIPPLYGSYEPDDFNPATAPSDLQRIVDSLAPFVDHFLCETQSSLTEALHSLRAANTYDLPVWVSFTLLEHPVDGKAQLRSGESVTEATNLAVANGAEAILFNCSRPEIMEAAIIETIALDRDLLVGAYANAFVEKQAGYAANSVILTHRPDLDPTGYDRFVERWIELGVDIVGGCCGIMPHHIEAIATRG